MASSSCPKAKSYFGISDKYGLKLLTCLRVGHSDLRAHRFPKNFNCSSPVCSCDGNDETTDHYLMDCSLYDIPRRILFVKISEILKTPYQLFPLLNLVRSFSMGNHLFLCLRTETYYSLQSNL